MPYQRGPAVAFTLVLLLSIIPLTGLGHAQDLEDTGAFGQAGAVVAGVTGPATDIVAPTSGAPAFHLEGETAGS